MYTQAHTHAHRPLGESKEHLCVSIHLCDWLSPGQPPSFTVSLTTVSPETLLSWCHVKRSSVAPVGLSTMIGEHIWLTNHVVPLLQDKRQPGAFSEHSNTRSSSDNTPNPLHCMFKLTCDVDMPQEILTWCRKCVYRWLCTCFACTWVYLCTLTGVYVSSLASL